MKLSPSVLMPYSIESFFSHEEVRRVLQSIDSYKASNPDRLEAGAHAITIHSNPNLTVPEVIAIFEPAGRVDINTQHLPRDVIEIAECAFYRHIEDIRRAYPTALGPYGFTYVEYGVGQYFTPHVDGCFDEQIAGFGVTLTDDFEGGEFLVQTCGSNRMWTSDTNGRLMVESGHDVSSEWFRSLPKTEWVTRPKCGNAIFYGSALTHGSKPVTRRRLKKLLGFIH